MFHSWTARSARDSPADLCAPDAPEPDSRQPASRKTKKAGIGPPLLLLSRYSDVTYRAPFLTPGPVVLGRIDAVRSASAEAGRPAATAVWWKEVGATPQRANRCCPAPSPSILPPGFCLRSRHHPACGERRQPHRPATPLRRHDQLAWRVPRSARRFVWVAVVVVLLVILVVKPNLLVGHR